MAGVSQGSMFFSQFSIVGLGMSPGSNSPAIGVISVKVSQSSPTKHIHKTNPQPTNSPALRNVNPGLLADLNHTPAPQPSHQPRVISLPLSAFCVYVLGSGLAVSMSAVCTKRWAECLCVCAEASAPGVISEMGSIRIRKECFFFWGGGCSNAHIAPAHLRQSMQSGDERGGSANGAFTCNGQRLLSLTA